MFRTQFEISTSGRGCLNITEHLADAIHQAGGPKVGLACLFVHHTSASLIITENADRRVLGDLETWISGSVVDGDGRFTHTAEGPDDMSAHIRSIITATSLNVPIRDGIPDLGTWQGVFLFEHRNHPMRRRVSITVLG